MKIWRCDCYDKDLGTLVSWHASRKDAAASLRAWQKKRGGESTVGPEGIREVIIPTDMGGLLAWLNAHFDTDNG